MGILLSKNYGTTRKSVGDHRSLNRVNRMSRMNKIGSHLRMPSGENILSVLILLML